MSNHCETRILALHGFTGCGGDFTGVREALAETGLSGARWHCPDLPGHGPDPQLDCTPEATVLAVEAARAPFTLHPSPSTLHPSPFTLHHSPFTLLLGYSMGARAALRHALRHPQAWDALILISPNPGIEDPTERAARRAGDEALAERIEREGVPAFLDWWQNQPLIRSQRSIPADARDRMRTGRLRHTAEGLAASLRQFGQGSCPDLWPELNQLKIPVFLICGEQDAKYRAIAERMEKELAQATLAVIPGAGHAPQMERPAETADAVASFTRRL